MCDDGGDGSQITVQRRSNCYRRRCLFCAGGHAAAPQGPRAAATGELFRFPLGSSVCQRRVVSRKVARLGWGMLVSDVPWIVFQWFYLFFRFVVVVILVS